MTDAGQGIPEEWEAAIRAWAEGEPVVLEVYAFGSRVKGGFRPDSDLDLALEIAGETEGEKLGNAICLKEGWLKALDALLPVKPHIQSMMPDDEVVTPAVRDHGVLIYRR